MPLNDRNLSDVEWYLRVWSKELCTVCHGSVRSCHILLAICSYDFVNECGLAEQNCSIRSVPAYCDAYNELWLP